MWILRDLPAWKATFFIFNIISSVAAKRHVVYWNSTNTRLTQGDLSIQMNLNDYLDIYCPYYPTEGPKASQGTERHEKLALYLIGEKQFQGCVETTGSIKRWECNAPRAPFGPVRFSEKIQRFTPFSLGFEFLPGRHYYYSSLAIEEEEDPSLPCMKLRVTVCCEPKSGHLSSFSSQRTASFPLLFILLLLLLTTWPASSSSLTSLLYSIGMGMETYYSDVQVHSAICALAVNATTQSMLSYSSYYLVCVFQWNAIKNRLSSLKRGHSDSQIDTLNHTDSYVVFSLVLCK